MNNTELENIDNINNPIHYQGRYGMQSINGAGGVITNHD